MSFAHWPERASGLGLASWAREMATLTRAFVRPPPFPAEPLPRGAGEGVLVIPGFLTDDRTTARLRAFLRRQGYRAEGSLKTPNFGPTAQRLARVKQAAERLAEETGGPVALVGQSLGGVFARELAKQLGGKVAAVATLCTPIRLPVKTPLAPFVWGLQGRFDPAVAGAAHALLAPPAQPVLALYSKRDGIVDWRACLPEPGGHERVAEVSGAAHTTIGSNPLAQAALARFLFETLCAAKQTAQTQ